MSTKKFTVEYQCVKCHEAIDANDRAMAECCPYCGHMPERSGYPPEVKRVVVDETPTGESHD